MKRAVILFLTIFLVGTGYTPFLRSAKADTKQELLKIQRYIIDLQQQLWNLQKQLEQQQTQTMKMLKALEEQVQESRTRIEALSHQNELLLNEVQALKAQLEVLKRGRSYSQPGTGNPENPTPPVETPSVSGSETSPVQKQPDLFQIALSDYYKGAYDLAIQELSQFIENAPEDPRVPDAHYWIAECMFSKKAYLDAIVRFENFIRLYGNHKKAPSALYKKGLAFLQLGKKAQAVSEFRNLVHLYPESQEAQAARDQMKLLGVSPDDS